MNNYRIRILNATFSKLTALCLIGLIVIIKSAPAATLPKHFCHLHDIAPSIVQDLRYFTSNNFIGRPITGYYKPQCLLTMQAAHALANVQKQLAKKGLGIKVFDCYRPQMAVNDFITWSKDKSDQKMKEQYYPRVDKADFFKLGFVATRSGHTRGSTADLTLVDLATKKELDMGGQFDFMDKQSHPFAKGLTTRQFQNRMLLRRIMIRNGFKPLSTEWWHFTLRNEPYPRRYFNFPLV